MKIALVPFNPVVGDIFRNFQSIIKILDRLTKNKVDLAVFPELALCGYPPKDLLDKPSFIADNKDAIERLSIHTKNIKCIAGFVDSEKDELSGGVHFYNAAAYMAERKVQAIAHKTLLPMYDIFDEQRYFAHAKDVVSITIGDKKFGISICEDMWFDYVHKYAVDPIAKLAGSGIDYLINISASPYEEGKLKKRIDLIRSKSKKHGVPVLYVNQLGGNDSVIFDGGSYVTDRNGNLSAWGERFKEDILIFDTDRTYPPLQFAFPDPELDVIDALTLGIRDYVHKTGFKKAVLGLSGGIDSALTAVLAVKALGKENVIGVSMPSRFSSEGSISDARHLAENLGIELYSIPIEPVLEQYLVHLTPFFHGRVWDITEENIQARIRGTILMALSNKHNWLLLSTGNKSELAVGYCTLYGDMCGGLAVIADIFKTRVYTLAEALNRGQEMIPRASIEKPPSAELRHNQTDQDSLPPYDILDGILKAYIEEYKSHEEIVSLGYDPETVLRVIQMVDRSEYKRKQAALGLKVSVKAFGEGRRIPIVQNYVPLDHCVW